MSHCGAGLFKRLAHGPGLVLKEPPSDPASSPGRQAERKQKIKHISQAFKKNFAKIPKELKTVNATLRLTSQHLTHNAACCCESVPSRATTSSSPMMPTQINVPFQPWSVKLMIKTI